MKDDFGFDEFSKLFRESVIHETEEARRFLTQELGRLTTNGSEEPQTKEAQMGISQGKVLQRLDAEGYWHDRPMELVQMTPEDESALVFLVRTGNEEVAMNGRIYQLAHRGEGASPIENPIVREADPELEKLLAEEEEIATRTVISSAPPKLKRVESFLAGDDVFLQKDEGYFGSPFEDVDATEAPHCWAYSLMMEYGVFEITVAGVRYRRPHEVKERARVYRDRVEGFTTVINPPLLQILKDLATDDGTLPTPVGRPAASVKFDFFPLWDEQG